jgi:quercetin dioxygenase-like cupin family protein
MLTFSVRFMPVALPGALLLACATLGAQQPPSAGHHADPDSLVWRPAGPRAEIAVIDGDPQSTGSFAIALRFQAGGMIPPHFHPNETRVVVVRGQVQVGFGDEADTVQTKVLGPGGYAVVPAEAHHFEAGKSDAMIIVYGVGPLKSTMVKAGAAHP